MRHFTLMLAAAGLAVPVAVIVPTDQVQAKKHRRYYAQSSRRSCRHSSGTTGLVAGGVGGALVGRGVFGHGLLGTAAGAAGGALGGRAIDRTITAKKRCR